MSGRAEILFVGDVHLGRRPGRLPPALRERGLEPSALGPRAAFEALVDTALEREVRAVAFLGDVVDREEHYYEAYGVLQGGVRRLVEAGIEVLAVAGNHDVRALPKLVAEVEGFSLLGAGGRWEERLVRDRSGAPLARLVGWSFPRARVTESPLAELARLALAPRTDVPTIGLLHCDLDQRASAYAPVARRELEQYAFVDAWLCGHVHTPSHAALRAPRPLGYLGSLTGLDPTETGVHGPWLARLAGGRALSLEQLALAPLAWATLDVPIDALEAPDELGPALVRALRAFAEREGESFGAARALGCRLRLTGRSTLHRELAARARGEDARELTHTDRAGRIYFVDRLEDRARAALELERLARSADPPGLLARKLLALERGDEQGTALARAARERLTRLGERAPWTELARALDEEHAREHLLRAGEAALEELLAQRRPEARA